MIVVIFLRKVCGGEFFHLIMDFSEITDAHFVEPYFRYAGIVQTPGTHAIGLLVCSFKRRPGQYAPTLF